jgi:metal-sulfur cluster biosynthetic enzyme
MAGAQGPVREAVWRTLEEIIDPCSAAMGAPAGLVSLGLVRTVQVEEREDAGTHVRVTLCITEPGCLMAALFQQAAHERLCSLPGVGDVEVRVDHGHVWAPDQMDSAYRARLTRLRAQRLAHMHAQQRVGAS